MPEPRSYDGFSRPILANPAQHTTPGPRRARAQGRLPQVKNGCDRRDSKRLSPARNGSWDPSSSAAARPPPPNVHRRTPLKRSETACHDLLMEGDAALRNADIAVRLGIDLFPSPLKKKKENQKMPIFETTMSNKWIGKAREDVEGNAGRRCGRSRPASPNGTGPPSPSGPGRGCGPCWGGRGPPPSPRP
jgi:hypothetical protein